MELFPTGKQGMHDENIHAHPCSFVSRIRFGSFYHEITVDASGYADDYKVMPPEVTSSTQLCNKQLCTVISPYPDRRLLCRVALCSKMGKLNPLKEPPSHLAIAYWTKWDRVFRQHIYHHHHHHHSQNSCIQQPDLRRYFV